MIIWNGALSDEEVKEAYEQLTSKMNELSLSPYRAGQAIILGMEAFEQASMLLNAKKNYKRSAYLLTGLIFLLTIVPH